MARRSQILWTLWNLYGSPKKFLSTHKDIPSVFMKRVVSLLEFGVGVSPDGRAAQSGVDQEYDELGVFELALGLTLFDSGVPRTEAVNFVLEYRALLTAEFTKMKDTEETARVFMMLTPRFMQEAHTTFGNDFGTKRWRTTPFLEPIFIYSIREVVNFLDNLSYRQRSCLVIELRELASAIIQLLPKAPLTRRGVKS